MSVRETTVLVALLALATACMFAKVASSKVSNMAYNIEVIAGDPRWKPIQVFDDGAKTIIRFPATMAAREAPALIVHRSAHTQLVNCRVRPRPGRPGIDHEIDQPNVLAELRLGQDDDVEVVQITRDEPRR